ncbi:gluconate kinase, partial [Escherichia coli]
SQFEALERPQADEQDIVRIDINHDIANVTEQCRQAVLAIRQNRICAKEGSASDQRCE